MNNKRRQVLQKAALATLGVPTTLSSLHSAAQPAAQKLIFCAVGDTPYLGSDERALIMTFEDAVAQACTLVTHIGDIKSSWDSCSDELIAERIALLNQSTLPLFFVPGDNEWTDCGKAILSSYNPENRLEYLRSLSAHQDHSLGKKHLPLERQAKQAGPTGIPENIRWIHGQCAFIGINLSGSYVGVGINGVDEKKRLEREKANASWLASASDWAEQNKAKAMVLLAHANAGIEGGANATVSNPRKRIAFTPFKQSLDTLLGQWQKPLLLVHGDTHRFKFDAPWRPKHPHFRRLEVFGAPFTNSWAKVSIDFSVASPSFDVTVMNLVKN